MKHPRIATAVTTCVLVLLAGCASQPPRPLLDVPGPLDLPPRTTGPRTETQDLAPPEVPTFQRSGTPVSPISSQAVAGLDTGERLPVMGQEPVSINVQDIPVPVLVNEIFGNLLGLNVTMSPQVTALDSLVTLNTRDAVPPSQLFRIARQVLSDYGVAVNIEGDLVRLEIASAGTSAEPPLIVSGRALPDVPISHRPVFQLIELEVVRSSDALRWLLTIFGNDLKATEDSARNTVMLSGKPAQVRQAVEALHVLDRPVMRGRISARLEPAFLTADQLSTSLTQVLATQGYGVTTSAGSPASVIVMPVAAANTVLVFASTRQSLDYAVSWARELDRPGQMAGQDSLFYYQVRNTKAADIASVLTGSGGGSAAPAANPDGATGQQPTAAGAAPNRAQGTRTTSTRGSLDTSLIVDEPRNALIYQGDPGQWERMLTLIRQMDRTPRQVMIEVTIAEVTLTDNFSFGVSWFARHGFDRFDGSIWGGTGSGGVPPGPSGGLTYLLDVAGQNRVALNAFANDKRVKLLSTPRLLVKSGSPANIDVGTEVPTVTMSTTSNQQTDGNTNLLQSIQYRKTGIILEITPTVYSDDRIDLEIRQEVSEALPLEPDATANSPSIFNRSLNTSLSLRDGGSVVMAGMISDRSTNVDAGVPLLKDVPLLGNLFKNKTTTRDRTELVLVIVPYIVESDGRSAQVSRAVVDKLTLLELDHVFEAPEEEAPLPAPREPESTGLPPQLRIDPVSQ